MSSKHTTLDQLKLLAQRTKSEIDKVDSKALVGVKVNGTALSIAEKMVDILIATGATNGTLAVNGVDVAVKGLAALIGSDTGKSVRAIANEELAAQLIPEGAQESLNTLTEIAQWIQSHPDDAATMNAAIAKLNEIVAGIGGEEDDYATVMAAIEGKIAAAMEGIEVATDEEVTTMLDEVFGAVTP